MTSLPQARLLFRTGPLRGKAFPLEGPRASIGRDAGNEVAVPDDIVSSFHASVLLGEGGVYWLEDSGSKNGTYLNGRRVDRERLEDGDRFSLCQYGPEIQFVAADAGGELLFDSTRTDFAQTGFLEHQDLPSRRRGKVFTGVGLLLLSLGMGFFCCFAGFSRREFVTLVPRLEPLYGSLFLSYRERPIGEVEVKNEGDRCLSGCELKLKFLDGAASFLAEPWSAAVPEVRPHAAVVLRLAPKLSSQVLADQTREVTAAVSLVRGEEVLAEASRALFVHGRHVFSWESPERLAAFVDPGDPVVQKFVRSAWELRPDTGKGEFPPPNVVSALTLLTALAGAGLHYLPDPANPISERVDSKAIDSVKYPGETLLERSGDCDDLSVLSCAVLEAARIPTAFAVGAGHVFFLFDSGIGAKDLAETPLDAGTVVSWGERIWVPIESTDFARPGSTFLSAWASAWPRSKAATAGALKIVETESGWRDYQPMNPPPDEAARDRMASTEWTRDETAGRVRAALGGLKRLFMENLAQRIEEIESRQEAGPERAEAVGLLYAKSGLFEEGRRAFERALFGDGNPSPGTGLTSPTETVVQASLSQEAKAALLADLALCLTLGSHSDADLESAARYSEMAIGCLAGGLAREKGEMMLRLAVVHRLRGDLAAEKSWTSKAFALNPLLEETYQRLVSSEGPVSGPDGEICRFLRQGFPKGR